MINFQQIKLDVSAKRDEAKREAKKMYSCVQSRGVYFYLDIDNSGNEFEAESFPWDGTKKQIESTLHYAKQSAGNKPFILGLQGSFNGADSVRDLSDCNYDPHCTDWSLEIYNTITEKVKL